MLAFIFQHSTQQAHWLRKAVETKVHVRHCSLYAHPTPMRPEPSNPALRIKVQRHSPHEPKHKLRSTLQFFLALEVQPEVCVGQAVAQQCHVQGSLLAHTAQWQHYAFSATQNTGMLGQTAIRPYAELSTRRACPLSVVSACAAHSTCGSKGQRGPSLASRSPELWVQVSTRVPARPHAHAFAILVLSLKCGKLPGVTNRKHTSAEAMAQQQGDSGAACPSQLPTNLHVSVAYSATSTKSFLQPSFSWFRPPINLWSCG